MRAAENRNATYFHLDDWADLSRDMTRDEMWEINVVFLNNQIEQGKRINLSHDPSKATGAFYNEVELLIDSGFRFIKDGEVWRAVR